MANSRSSCVLYTAFDVEIFPENEKATIDTYINFFLDLKKRVEPVPLSRSNYLQFDVIKPFNEDNPQNGIKCEIFKSTGISSDFRDRKKAENVRIEQKEYLSEDLKAKPRDFTAVFYPLQKKLICEIAFKKNKTSQAIIEDFLLNLIKSPFLIEKYTRIIIKPVREEITADDINHNPTLTYVEAVINEIPDSFDDESALSASDKVALKELADSNLKSYKQEFVSRKTKFIELTEENKQFIRLAVAYGYVKVKYKNSEDIIEEKNTSVIAPFTKRLKYLSKDNYSDFLERETRKIAQSLV